MSDSQHAEMNRWPFYHLLIVVALGIAAGRIAVVKSPEGDTAFLSANDRSRWATVACLVERGTYVIDEQIAIANPIHRNRRPWNSIDKVRHLGRDGKQHFYSSKPPLLATVVAGVYKVASMASGMTLTAQPIYMARIILALVNLPLLAIFLYATIATIDRLIRCPWAGNVAAAACCFGTMVLPFTVTLNNHLVACAATALVMWLYAREAWCARGAADSDSASPSDASSAISFKWTALAGLAAAMAAANELPALSMTVFWLLLFAWLDRATIVPFACGVLVVAVAFFGTNWLAHQSFRPPYMHRGNGAVIAELAAAGDQPDEAMIAEIQSVLNQDRFADETSDTVVELSDEAGRWIVHRGERLFALLQSQDKWQLAHWDDWYEYPGTYWKDGTRRGVDRGEPSRFVYLLHMTIGHHGLFSLTPIWFMMPIGLVMGLFHESASMKRFFAAVLVASVVCFAFYLSRPLIDRNYGGVSVCFRWMLWFAPLWLVAVSPVIERWEASKGARLAVLSLLACSVFSVATSLQTPWQSPWLYQFWQFLGWLGD